MGRIAGILAQIELPPASKTETFGIRQCGNRVAIHYRRLRFECDLPTFLQCARALRVLDQAQIAAFQFSPTAFKEVVNLNTLAVSFAGGGKVTWTSIGSRNVLRYRCLRVRVRAGELSALLQQFKFRRRRYWESLKLVARRLLGRPNHPDRPMLAERFSVDLCENIHVHFQNFRLEFSLSEFLTLWEISKTIDIDALSPWHCGWLCRGALPSTTEWDRRLQLEEQVEGHYHLHYRNLRIEFRDFAEIGVNLGASNSLRVDGSYLDRFVRPNGWQLAGIKTRTLGDLRALVFTPSGVIPVPLRDSPIYQSLVAQDQSVYENYRAVVLSQDSKCDYDWVRFQSLWRDIRDHGFNQQHPLVTQGPHHHLVDGQHRASILLHLFGPDLKVKVVHYA